MKFGVVFLLCIQTLFGVGDLSNKIITAQPVQKTKVLHLTFHRGCEIEIQKVAQALSLDLTTWFIQDLPPKFFDGQTIGNALYNIGHERAERIWSLHKEFFESFDIVITSDTAPLSRIFLQNNWTKPLVIWICNRFDYYDGASLDCDFPDREYYDLFSKACHQDNVKVVGYTAYEHIYAKAKGIDTGSLLIKPIGYITEMSQNFCVPAHVIKEETFFLPPYHNETFFMNLQAYCNQLNIKAFCGKYNGAKDLGGFKAIIHLPYAWSNLALFENLQLGMVYFIPSVNFLRSLYQKGNYFIPNMNEYFYSASEWYCEENAPAFIYFDS
ncbi:MAG: hypothetical protein JSS09_10265, partial [Verrucomicrobia bacterium]|nr:hypothetical protein [Verrucomicrobiota bacterium]